MDTNNPHEKVLESHAKPLSLFRMHLEPLLNGCS